VPVVMSAHVASVHQLWLQLVLVEQMLALMLTLMLVHVLHCHWNCFSPSMVTMVPPNSTSSSQ